MGWGLFLIGLFMVGLIAAGGQLWLEHTNLQDALENAIIAQTAGAARGAGPLARMVQSNSGSAVTVTQYQSSGSSIRAAVTAPAKIWFWARWLADTGGHYGVVLGSGSDP